METWRLLLNGFAIALQPQNLLSTFAGVLVGQVIGALPGIGPALGMVLLLPISFGLEPVTAIVMLAGIMYGAMYGGTITSVLINIPGESASVMTAVEGQYLAKQGKAGAALSIAAVGSFIAGAGSILALIFAAVGISQFALRFSAPEYFLLAAIGILATASLATGSMVKALIVAVFGLMLALVGVDPILGSNRLTFGSTGLLDGIDFMPVAIGVFGIAEVLVSLERPTTALPRRMRMREMWPKWSDWKACRMAIARGGTIGFFLGLLPGVGPTASTFIAYAAERRFSKHPEKFGKGALDAVASVESANNSSVTGSLVPMLTLGIPGSGMTAVLLAALILHGIMPGPLLMTEQPEVVWGLIASMFVGNAILLVLNLPLAPVFALLLRVPYPFLAPAILLLSVIGAYATTLDMFVVALTLIFGLIGYLMIKLELPRAPLILALVLAPIMESSLRQSLILSQGSLGIFVQRPMAACLLIIFAALLLWPILATVVRRKAAR